MVHLVGERSNWYTASTQLLMKSVTVKAYLPQWHTFRLATETLNMDLSSNSKQTTRSSPQSSVQLCNELHASVFACKQGGGAQPDGQIYLMADGGVDVFGCIAVVEDVWATVGQGMC